MINSLNWVQVEGNIKDKINETLHNNDSEIVSMNFVSTREVKVPVSILNEIYGKNILLAFHNGKDAAMSVNGWELMNVDLSKIVDINMTIVCDTDYIPETALSTRSSTALFMRQISVLNAGQMQIPVYMHVKVDDMYVGQWANLYRYNVLNGMLEPAGICQIVLGGHAAFPITEGGNYLLTVSAQVPVTDTELPVLPQMPDANNESANASSQYTVRRGDSLSKIARANGMTLAELLSMNPQVTDINRINVGQVLNIG